MIYTESFVSALVGIGRHFDGAAEFDLHADNLMYDEDSGEFIITDPVSFTKEKRYVVEHSRPNRARTNHPAPAQARANAGAFARNFGAGVTQVRNALFNRHPRSLEVVRPQRFRDDPFHVPLLKPRVGVVFAFNYKDSKAAMFVP